MSQWKAGADVIAGLLKEVDGVGNVYVGEEDEKTLADIQELADSPRSETELIEDQAKINIWQITRVGIAIEGAELPQAQSFRIHRLVIRGYYGEGQDTFQPWHDILDSVLDLFDSLTSLPQESEEYNLLEITDVSMPTIGHSKFGPYGCHSAEVQLSLREWRKTPRRHAV